MIIEIHNIMYHNLYVIYYDTYHIKYIQKYIHACSCTIAIEKHLCNNLKAPNMRLVKANKMVIYYNLRVLEDLGAGEGQ